MNCLWHREISPSPDFVRSSLVRWSLIIIRREAISPKFYLDFIPTGFHPPWWISSPPHSEFLIPHSKIKPLSTFVFSLSTRCGLIFPHLSTSEENPFAIRLFRAFPRTSFPLLVIWWIFAVAFQRSFHSFSHSLFHLRV